VPNLVKKACNKSYSLEASCLYRIPGPTKLAELLLVGKSELESLANRKSNYYSFKVSKKSGGSRTIDAPFNDLKKLQSRIAQLLQSIAPPPFLMAPVRGRSYVDNAAVHVGAVAFRLLDISDYFPSCTAKRVFWFFNSVMKCPPDVAAILTKLTTLEGRLPQGSPASPILAFYCNKDLWTKIDMVARRGQYALSLYIDDLTISSKTRVLEADIWEIKELIRTYGLKICDKKERSIFGKPAKVTGVIVSMNRLQLPNSQHKALKEVRDALRATSAPERRRFLKNQLSGRMAQAKQIINHASSSSLSHNYQISL
jgi:Reverse transcriptase (RNA-dependent DNA polymerase)